MQPIDKPASAVPAPDPTALLFLIALICAWAWFFGGASWLAILLPGVVLAVALVSWLGARQEIAVALLIGASAMPRLAVPIAGMNARPEHVLAGCLLLVLPFWLRKRRPQMEWALPDYLVIAYVAMNLYSSLFASIAPGQTIKWASQQALVIVPYFVLRVYATDAQRFRRLFHIVLVVGVLEATYGIVSFYSNLLIGTEFGVSLGQYEDIAAAYGLQYEPNLLGSYCGACCVMFLVMYFLEGERKYLYGYAIALTAMGVSFSRAALLATSGALFILLLWFWWKKRLERKVLFRTGVATVVVAVALSPVLLAPYMARFSTLEVSQPLEDPNTAFRAVQVVSAWDDIVAHPLVGNGTSSFQLMFNWEDVGLDFQNQGWIPNTEERVLHDTGILGLGILLLFLGTLARRSWRILERGKNAELLALILSALVYCATFQATEGTLLAFTWVHLGLIACAISLYQNMRSDFTPE